MKDLSKIYDQTVPGHFETDDYVFFWAGPFSNWHHSVFTVGENEFTSAEQALMYLKATTFNDESSAKRIMATDSPREQKRLGRLVENFDADKWAIRRESFFYYLLAKFDQNPDLMEILEATGDKIIVEASPYDTIWGIGMSVNDYPDILDREKWLGDNILGEYLMMVREYCREGANWHYTPSGVRLNREMSENIRDEIDAGIVKKLVDLATNGKNDER